MPQNVATPANKRVRLFQCKAFSTANIAASRYPGEKKRSSSNSLVSSFPVSPEKKT